jgi:glycosyltransferase involved in cell wall biosynthesis
MRSTTATTSRRTVGSSRPLVTILTPCFNHERFLGEYFAGLLAQTYQNAELIIFDDDSTDRSWDVIQAHIPALERKFTRVVAERHANIGGTRELDLAIDRARGELLCILESDDYYLPTKLEENVRFLVENPGVGAVHSDTDYVHPDRVEHGHWRAVRRPIPTGEVFEELLIANFVMTCAFCCRTELYRAHVDQGDYLRRGYKIADNALFLDLARHTRFGYIDKALARYRVAAGSLSRPVDAEGSYQFMRSGLRMRLDYMDDPRVSRQVAERVEREYYEHIYRRGMRLGHKADALEGYRWLLARYPREYGGVRHRWSVRFARLPELWQIGNRIGVVPLARRLQRLRGRLRST